MRRSIIVVFFWSALWLSRGEAAAAASQPSCPAGAWEGLIVVRPAEFEVDFEIEVESRENGSLAGRISYPAQRITGAPLESFRLEAGKVTFVARDEAGIVSTFEGWLASDCQSIRGDLAESGEHYLFELRRSKGSELGQAVAGDRLRKLSTDGAELRSVFNDDRGRVRLLMILAPTCPMCLNGARLVQRYVLDAVSDPNLRVYVIWEPIGARDDEAMARTAASFLSDPRVLQFWSEERFAGRTFQTAVGLKESPAWDVFLLFPGDRSWKEGPPAFSSFMHNLVNRDNLPKDRRLHGTRLTEEIRTLLAGTPAR